MAKSLPRKIFLWFVGLSILPFIAIFGYLVYLGDELNTMADAPPALTTGDDIMQVCGQRSNGAELCLPEASKGKPAVYMFWFEECAIGETNGWRDALTKLLQQEENAFEFYDVFIFPEELSLLSDFGLDHQYERLPKRYHEKVVAAPANLKKIYTQLGVIDQCAAYVVTVDEEGKITYQYRGPQVPESFALIKQHLPGGEASSIPPSTDSTTTDSVRD